MTNEEKEKAREIAYKHKQQCYYSPCGDLDNSFEECYQSALEAMDWKDEQQEQKKQQWIKEACERVEEYFAPDGSMVPENIRLWKDLQRVIKGE